MRLPPGFVHSVSGFAGGVEKAFMSTSTSIKTAVDYSGGKMGNGSIFQIAFDQATRGARLAWLSQYPKEHEILFPPCTSLTCQGVQQVGVKRVLLVSAAISTNRPDVGWVSSIDTKPGAQQRLVIGEALDDSVLDVDTTLERNGHASA